MKKGSRRYRGFPGGAVIKNHLPMQETQVWSLCQKGPLAKELEICSSVLIWRIQWTEEPGWLQTIGRHRVGHA